MIVKKRKKLVKSKKIVKEELRKWVITIDESYATFKLIYDYQNLSTKDAIDTIQYALVHCDRHDMAVKIGNTVTKTTEETIEKNQFVASVKIALNLASFGIRLANFKISRSNCGFCGKRIKRKSLSTVNVGQTAKSRVMSADITYIIADTLQECYIYPAPERVNAENVAIEVARAMLYYDVGVKITNHGFDLRYHDDCS